MPSPLHEALVLLFRNRATLAAELLYDIFHVPLPAFDRASVESAELADVPPTQLLADLVVVLRHDDAPVYGIVVEVQLSPAERKRLTWPAYAANLRVRLGCPTSVLVVCGEESVARWARQPIMLGGGNHYTPIVLGPAAVPVVSEFEAARADPELAVLAALAHARDDSPLARAVADVALAASAALDDDRATFYFDVIANVLSEATRKALLEMHAGKYEYQSEFAKRYFGEGRAAGVAEGEARGEARGEAKGEARGEAVGRVELLRRQLTHRFGALPAQLEQRLRSASIAELDTYAERILDAANLDDVFTPGGNG